MPVDWYYNELQQTVCKTVNHPDFTAALPPLSDESWVKILNTTPRALAENDRLEFLGDAIMYAIVGRQLFDQIPDGTPHLYSCVRSALHSNKTFSLLAEKLDIMAVSDTVLRALTRRTFGEGSEARRKDMLEMKATADLFETIIAVYYLDNGFEALYEWVKEIYEPLIDAAAKTFYKLRRGPPKSRYHRDPHIFTLRYEARRFYNAPPGQRLLSGGEQHRQRGFVQDKHRAKDVARRSVSVKARIMSRDEPSLPATPRLLPAVAPQQASSSSKAAIPPPPVVQKAAPIFIDLTLSDSEDEMPIDMPLRHPLVTPRIHRPSPAVSKRPTPAPIARLAVDSMDSASSEEEEESLLEIMLTADTSDSDSDMDCGSSDLDSPAHPSSLPPLLTRAGSYRSVFDLGSSPKVLPHMGLIFK